MKHIFVAGNWKSNKTRSEADVWLREFKVQSLKFKVELQKTSIVLCVPFTLLSLLHDQIHQFQLPIQLGAQDVSPYPSGAYTGAVNARQLKELVDWVIIGHSERRKYFRETDIVLAQKVQQAKDAGLQIIYCVQDEHVIVPQGVDVISYEPPWAISAVSNWKTQDPKVAGDVCAIIKKKNPDAVVLYGGSASAENVISFLSQPAIEGILSGGASLDAEKFYQLIQNSTKEIS